MTETKPDPYILKQKKKRRKIILTILLSVVFVLALFILKIILICTAKPTISTDYAAELNRISKPKNYDPNSDAFFDYMKAAKIYIKPDPNIPCRLTSLDEPTEEQLAAVEPWVAANQQSLRYLENGLAKPYVRFEYNEHNFDGVTIWPDVISREIDCASHLTEALLWRAKSSSQNGNINSAIKDLMNAQRLAMQLKTLLLYWRGSFMEREAIEQSFLLLSKNKIEGYMFKDLQEFFEEQEPLHERDVLLEWERIRLHDLIQRIYTDDGKGNGHLIPTKRAKILVGVYLYSKKPEPSLDEEEGFLWELWDEFVPGESFESDVYCAIIRMALLGPNRKETTESVNRYFDLLDTLKNKTPWQLRQMKLDTDEDILNKSKANFFVQASTSLSGESLLDHLIGVQIRRTRINALIATLGVLRYKTDMGYLPESLQHLVDTNYLERMPMDPYSSGPLVYKRNGTDFVLYSFGPDFDDDGGSKGSQFQFTNRPNFDLIFWPVKEWDSND